VDRRHRLIRLGAGLNEEGRDRVVAEHIPFDEHTSRLGLGDLCAKRLAAPKHPHLKADDRPRADPPTLDREIAELLRQDPRMAGLVVRDRVVDTARWRLESRRRADDVGRLRRGRHHDLHVDRRRSSRPGFASASQGATS